MAKSKRLLPDVRYYMPNVKVGYIEEDGELKYRQVIYVDPDNVKKYGKLRAPIGYSSKSSADWFGLIHSNASNWDDIKLIMAYSYESDIVNVVCIYDYYDTPLSAVNIDNVKPDKIWYQQFLDSIKNERNRYLEGYISLWSDYNENLYQRKCTGKYRGKHDVQSFLQSTTKRPFSRGYSERNQSIA